MYSLGGTVWADGCEFEDWDNFSQYSEDDDDTTATKMDHCDHDHELDMTTSCPLQQESINLSPSAVHNDQMMDQEKVLRDQLTSLQTQINTIQTLMQIKKEQSDVINGADKNYQSHHDMNNDMTPQLWQDDDIVDPKSRREMTKNLLQWHMALLLHAHQCQANDDLSQFCTVPDCWIVKRLLLHMRTCTHDKLCVTPHCFLYRQIISYWKFCHLGINTGVNENVKENLDATITKKDVKQDYEQTPTMPKFKLHEKFAQEPPAHSHLQEDTEEEEESKKLWCYCQQPHNNRNMICCDECNNWYHGTCVRVTRLEAARMEKNKINWYCPSCLKGSWTVGCGQQG